MKLISTKLTNLVSLEQSHHNPMGMYGGGPLKFTNYRYKLWHTHRQGTFAIAGRAHCEHQVAFLRHVVRDSMGSQNW